MKRHYRICAALTLTLWSAVTLAQWRCDCTTIIDSCTAEVSVADTWVDVVTDHRQCARVDYFIDGLPFVAVVVDGSERQNWLGGSNNPRVLVQSCQVCRDNAPDGAAPAASAATAEAEEGPLQPLIAVTPAYPEAAQRAGLDGYVDVQFTVGPGGEVQDVRVTGAEPADVFDAAAIDALQRRRYPADAAREPVTLTERMRFEFTEYVWRLPERSTPAAPSPTGPLNQCIREESASRGPQGVEISLLNTCREPLLVIGCAVGTGADHGRWACTDFDRLLVRRNDARLGSISVLDTLAGARSYVYDERLMLSRAPNSQYWWIACPEADSRCQDSARQWLRSMDGQLADVDPRARSALTVARSY